MLREHGARDVCLSSQTLRDEVQWVSVTRNESGFKARDTSKRANCECTEPMDHAQHHGAAGGESR